VEGAGTDRSLRVGRTRGASTGLIHVLRSHVPLRRAVMGVTNRGDWISYVTTAFATTVMPPGNCRAMATCRDGRGCSILRTKGDGDCDVGGAANQESTLRYAFYFVVVGRSDWRACSISRTTCRLP